MLIKTAATLSAVILFTFAATGTAYADMCHDFQAELKAASKVKDVAALEALYERAKKNDTICKSAQFVFCTGRTTALGLLNKSYDLYDAGDKVGSSALIEKAISFGAPWQVLFSLGELEKAKKTPEGYAAAASYFQQTLNEVAEADKASLCHGEDALLPDQVFVEKIHRQAVITMALADDFVQPPVTRSGKDGGIFLDSVRGFTPKARPIPINFVFREDSFTKKGEEAAASLLSYLKRNKIHEITISGHTDERGSNSFNLGLSKKRLAVVEAYLKGGGFTGKIKLMPKGESEPFIADDPGAYTEEQLFQLDRRVELRGAIK